MRCKEKLRKTTCSEILPPSLRCAVGDKKCSYIRLPRCVFNFTTIKSEAFQDRERG